VVSRVADAFGDCGGDLHSLQVGRGAAGRTLRGLLHAVLGWPFVHDQSGKRSRYAPGLPADTAVRVSQCAD
jgi:hypothetical protein